VGWKKRELIQEAYAEIAMQDSVFNIDPDMLQSALRRLDSMMATWDSKGIRVGYNLSTQANGSNLDDDSGIPDFANEAVLLHLAIRLAPGVGKTLSPSTAAIAKMGYDTLLNYCAQPIPMQYPGGMPRGAGNKPWRWQRNEFMPAPCDPLTAGQDDSPIDFI
jgi:hypothetical protein